MKNALILLVLSFLVVSCGGYDTKAKVDEIFEVHDEVMPMLGEVMVLKNRVLEKANSESDSLKVVALQELAQDLDNAQRGMMLWMNEWAANAEPHKNEQSNLEERKVFLEAEMDKVTKVKEDIISSIEVAKKELY